MRITWAYVSSVMLPKALKDAVRLRRVQRNVAVLADPIISGEAALDVAAVATQRTARAAHQRT